MLFTLCRLFTNGTVLTFIITVYVVLSGFALLQILLCLKCIVMHPRSSALLLAQFLKLLVVSYDASQVYSNSVAVMSSFL
jgi:hypothetical protein